MFIVIECVRMLSRHNESKKCKQKNIEIVRTFVISIFNVFVVLIFRSTACHGTSDFPLKLLRISWRFWYIAVYTKKGKPVINFRLLKKQIEGRFCDVNWVLFRITLCSALFYDGRLPFHWTITITSINTSQPENYSYILMVKYRQGDEVCPSSTLFF